MTELPNKLPRNPWLWIYPARTVLALLGLAIAAGSWFAFMVMLGFWEESNVYPSAFLEFAAGPGVTVFTIVACIYWIWRSSRGIRLNPWDLLILPLPSITIALYLTFQGSI